MTLGLTGEQWVIMILMTFSWFLVRGATMKTVVVQVSEAKKHFADYIAKSAGGDCRVVIQRRSRPVAALVSMDELNELEQLDKRRGLAAVAGRWDGFEEIEDHVLHAREECGEGRDVSL
jgi:prevent-host-death family protein